MPVKSVYALGISLDESGHRYYSYNLYYYHPYNPYVYGPAWRPVGFFIAALAFTTTVVAVENMHYRYDQGVYYQPVNGGWQVVPPPFGATVPYMPQGYEMLTVGDSRYYYYGGSFYYLTQYGYRVVEAPPGAIVSTLPAGCIPVQAGNVVYLRYNNSFFQPIQFNGHNVYEVVEIE